MTLQKFCPKCGRSFDNGVDLCDADGEKLVMVNEEPSLIGRVLEDKYKLTEIIGQGGMGTVYLGYQASMGRHVAVKVLKRRFAQEKVAIKRFLREARAASKLSHSNTITVYDFGQTPDGFLYMVMERLTGRALADVLDDEYRLTSARAVHVIGQICDSLAQAHDRGIQHRDLKPENIFIEPQAGNPDHVKVLDFGIAKMHDEEGSQATATGMVCGTPAYMSPEQAMGKDIDGRSDIYALGVLLFELLTGKAPFDGDAAMEIMLKQLNEEPPTVPEKVRAEVPEALLDAMYAMLAKAPKDRPADCREVKGLLMAAIGVTHNMALQHSMDVTSREGARSQPHEPSGVFTSFNKAARRAQNQSTEVLAGLGRSRGIALVAFLAAFVAASGVWVAVAFQSEEAASSPEVASKVAPSEPSAAAAPDGKARARSVVGPDSVDAQGAVDASRAANAPETEVPAPRVNLTIQSVPSGARVLDESGEFLGETQLTITALKGNGNFRVVLRLDGYDDATLSMSTAMDSKQVKELHRVGAVHDNSTKRSRRPTGGRRPLSSRRPPVVDPGPGNIGTF